MQQPFTAEISRDGRSDTLKVTMQPNASIIVNQDSMAYMDDGLQMEATLGNAGVSGAFMRGITGSSAIQTSIINPTQIPLKVYITPTLESSIAEIQLKQGDSWNFADNSFLACSPNLQVSGSGGLNNIKLLFAGENAIYVNVSAPEGPGTVWVYAYGGYEVHNIRMGVDPGIVINHGCFLGMLASSGETDYWSDYVSVSTTNGIFQSLATDTGMVMKITDDNPPIRPNALCNVLTQRLNITHLNDYIANISRQTIRSENYNQPETLKESVEHQAVSNAFKMMGSARSNKTYKAPRKILRLRKTRHKQ